jgi:lipopolysaccharide export system protein LptA
VQLRFLILFILFPTILFGQSRTQIVLQASSSLTTDNKTGISYVKNPVFLHDNATLSCDSAVLYKDRNFFEAFKNVHINQGDTLNIYSDLLTYNGNTKDAHLSNNVKLIDRTSTLTTNVLDYNLGTKYGTYSNGGKIVNKDGTTVTSKNGYYFATTKDAYFRYNVLVVTAQSTIKSDTLRYNTFTNWTYFYGPTNIKGKDDNLYTENGAYNTRDDNAYFGKKNLYTQGTKSLKGDSLYYYGKRGYGRAVKNITFMDTSDQTLLKGQLGEYYKADERVVVTKNAYFGMGTKDSIEVSKKKIPDTLWLGADTLEAQKVLQKTLKLLSKPVIEKDNEVGAEDAKAKELKDKEKAEARKQAAADKKLTKPGTETTVDPKKKLSKKERKLAEKQAAELKKNPPAIDTLKKKPDSTVLDSMKTKIIVAKEKPIIKSDSTAVKKVVGSKTKPISADKSKVTIAKKDTVAVFNPADTVRTRVIKAFHNVRVYKSNLQAKADSLFYTAADSSLRWYKNPILWSNGSQQTGDTIHVFFKNDKIHSFQVLQSGFIVNIETDSTKFNQVKGKKITGFLVDGDLRTLVVDGNAESMYYNKNDKGVYDNLTHSISSRMKFLFKDKELTDILIIKGNEGKIDPIDKLPKETLLTGFIWKPELRPVSKADIIKGKPASKPATKPKTPPVKTPSIKVPTTVEKKTDTKTVTPTLTPQKLDGQSAKSDTAKVIGPEKTVIKN